MRFACCNANVTAGVCVDLRFGLVALDLGIDQTVCALIDNGTISQMQNVAGL
jgi:hypothetical protein